MSHHPEQDAAPDAQAAVSQEAEHESSVSLRQEAAAARAHVASTHAMRFAPAWLLPMLDAAGGELIVPVRDRRLDYCEIRFARLAGGALEIRFVRPEWEDQR